MIVDREYDNHREIKSVGRCEGGSSKFCVPRFFDRQFRQL
ncbi:unnamed protein product [Callosobruchus maculatus]|uniref:Uncharacterized protein n=1 Tax=Callosobruchus maculatus TaxID=64391 RepID=A0A653BHX1_CALMS|nr:unnamed protein product [Callosobruchus maculatus]